MKITKQLQISNIKINDWTKHWRIKLNETKSAHVHLTNKKKQYILVIANNIQISFKYIKITEYKSGAGLHWKGVVKNKRQELNRDFTEQC